MYIRDNILYTSEGTLRLAEIGERGEYAVRMRIKASGPATVDVVVGDQTDSLAVTTAEQEYTHVFRNVQIADNPFFALVLPNGDYAISEIQLEKGNIVTGYQPSTQDVIADIQDILNASRATQAAFVRVSTAGATRQKVPDASISGFSLYVGVRVACLMLYANTANNPTLNVNGTGEYAIVTSDGTVLTSANSARIGWTNNSLVTYVWDGRFWRIDDSASLVKIDNILTENIVGTHGWINLGQGVFNFDNKLVWDGTTLNITGNLVSSKMTGGDIEISAEGDIEVTSGTYTGADKYYVDIVTEEGSRSIDGAWVKVPYILLQSYLKKTGQVLPEKEAIIRVDPVYGVDIDGPTFRLIGNGDTALEYLALNDMLASHKKLFVDEDIEATGNIETDEGRFVEQGDHYLNPLIEWPKLNDTLSGDASLASGTTTVSIDSFTLDDAGPHLVILHVEFSSNSSGRRYVCISDSNTGGAINNTLRAYAAAVNGGITTATIIGLLNPSSAGTTYYVRGYQNSGSALTVSCRLTALKLR